MKIEKFCDYHAEAEQYYRGDQTLLFGAVGAAAEAGELLNKVKKFVYHGAVFDEAYTESVLEEVGDVLWYLTDICDALSSSLEEVAFKNIEKLRKRHGK